ncbi:MAG: hypothetical protein GY869_02725, partial [Planctomycetes bacterium]|nr:hypothetical protein [Planctomycetota bacterium]
KLAGQADLWASSNVIESNESFGASGFDALPGGSRRIMGNFDNASYKAYFWSSTEFDTEFGESVWCRFLSCNDTWVYRINYPKDIGCSVRLVRD